jgi:hypothetical protein
MARFIGVTLIAVLCGACGEAVPPAPGSLPDNGPSGEGASPDEPSSLPTNKVVECGASRCIAKWMPRMVRYVVFPGAADGVDAVTDAYEDVPGSFDIRFVPASDGEVIFAISKFDDGTLYKDWGLPFPLAIEMLFTGSITLDFEVTDLSGVYPDIECHLEIFPDGTLVGGLVREPGVIVCSTNNWRAPQSPEEPGLLIEYGVCTWEMVGSVERSHCPF